ncbi:MAG: hypothetical protein KKG04_00875 [Candidatus Thermoplasmatota archaeon]|nr:hypothetical protein [Candidatus Thermoplasmatota archaeon]
MATKIIRVIHPDRFFGYLWIFSWIMAIWVFHMQFFIMGLFCLFLALIIFEKKTKTSMVDHALARLTMDKTQRSLVVQKLCQDGLKWDDYEVCSGQALLPSGPVAEGDIIWNCLGNVALRHVPTNSLLGAFDFSDGSIINAVTSQKK